MTTPAETATHSWEDVMRNLPRPNDTMHIGRQTIVLHEGFMLEVHGAHGAAAFTPDDLCLLRQVINDWAQGRRADGGANGRS